MKLVQLTPGAGGMYCGNCFRDNALVRGLRLAGHDVLMIPLYLPMTLDEQDQSAGTPTFFSGVNVYLEQYLPGFRYAPKWLHRWLASPTVLRWAGARAAKTRAADVGDLTVSMLRGQDGNQARELSELIAFLQSQGAPDAVCLSNAMLLGLARRIRSELGSRVVCMLQGEDTFLDALPEPARTQAWSLLVDRGRDVDLWIAPSRYFADLMGARLQIPPDRLRVVHNGIDLAGYPDQPPSASPPSAPPVLGYFARMCREKGLDTLVQAYRILRQRNRVPNLRLRIGGGCGPSDERFVAQLKEALRQDGVLDHVEFHPNVDRTGKLAFFQGLSVFSVPALYGEAFGLYLVEAWAAGVPVVQPRHAAFTELVESTDAGALCDPGNPESLAIAIEQLLLDEPRRRACADRAWSSVRTRFNQAAMTREIAGHLQSLRAAPATAGTAMSHL